MVRLLPVVPKGIVRRVSSRYIAGPDLADAVTTVKRLNAAGQMATVDVLGEEIDTEAGAEAIVGAYLEALDSIEAEGLDSNVSIKPTALGLGLDVELCRANVERIAERGVFVRIDMEDSS